MKRFHPLTVSGIKRCPVYELETIRTDFDLPLPVVGKRVLKKDYVALLTAYIATPAYVDHVHRYEYYRFRPFQEIPELYHTREVRQRSGIFDVFLDEDKTFDLCLKYVARYTDALRIPMYKFTSEEREKLIRASSSHKILQGLPVDEIVPWIPRWPLALQFVPFDKQTLSLCVNCVERSGWALQYCNPRFVTPGVENVAVRDAPYAIQWVTKDDPPRYHALCLLAVSIDGWAIEFIANPSSEVRKTALKQDWTCKQIIAAPFDAEELAIIEQGRAADELRKETIIRIDIVD